MTGRTQSPIGVSGRAGAMALAFSAVAGAAWAGSANEGSPGDGGGDGQARSLGGAESPGADSATPPLSDAGGGDGAVRPLGKDYAVSVAALLAPALLAPPIDVSDATGAVSQARLEHAPKMVLPNRVSSADPAVDAAAFAPSRLQVAYVSEHQGRSAKPADFRLNRRHAHKFAAADRLAVPKFVVVTPAASHQLNELKLAAAPSRPAPAAKALSAGRTDRQVGNARPARLAAAPRRAAPKPNAIFGDSGPALAGRQLLADPQVTPPAAQPAASLNAVALDTVTRPADRAAGEVRPVKIAAPGKPAAATADAIVREPAAAPAERPARAVRASRPVRAIEASRRPAPTPNALFGEAAPRLADRLGLEAPPSAPSAPDAIIGASAAVSADRPPIEVRTIDVAVASERPTSAPMRFFGGEALSVGEPVGVDQLAALEPVPAQVADRADPPARVVEAVRVVRTEAPPMEVLAIRVSAARDATDLDATDGPVCAGDAPAALSADGPFDGVQAVNDNELQDERGGFVMADGVTFDIGATVRTTVDGTLALVSTLSLTPGGQLQESTWVNPSLGNATTISPMDANALSAATGMDLHGLAGSTGLVLKEGSGVTAVLADIAPDRLQNLVINTANGQTIRQSTDITLTLPGFTQMQTQFNQASLTLQLFDALKSAQLQSLSR